MKHVRIDMVGKRFGRLVGVRLARISDSGDARWIFQCDCGREHEADGTHVRRGNTKSCGCLNKETYASRATTHGMSHTTEFRCWSSFINRCYNSHNNAFKNYGGRGITVCAEWRNSFEQFYADMGPRPAPHLTIERKNNNLGYSKENCVWGTNTDQSRNRRSVVLTLDLAREVRMVKVSGENISKWARDHGIKPAAAHRAASGRSWKEASFS